MITDRILIQYLYKDIILEFAKRTNKTIEESMDYLYKSDTYDLINSGIGDMHCKGVQYLTDELMLEYGLIKHKGYPESLVHNKK